MNKYNCRKCPIRSRCIQESNYSPGARVMIQRAFEAKTDTLSTWGQLQKNCLLVKAEEEHSTSALSDRLRKRYEPYDADQTQSVKTQTPSTSTSTSASALGSRLTKARSDQENESPPTKQKPKKPTRPLRSLTKKPKTGKLARHPDYLQPVSKPKAPQKSLKRLPPTGPLNQESFWLILENTGRRINLPVRGELAFGRFDPNVGLPPDIDLNYEDQEDHLISRRHVRFISQKGRHVIEDLGSRLGVFINGEALQTKSSKPLNPGDRIRLGAIDFIYDKMPIDVLQLAKTDQAQHIFTVTPTGRQIKVQPKGELTVGRADPHLTFVPDIDLREDGHMSSLVSRRHMAIRWRNGVPFLEDLGSSFGTKILGEMLTLGKSVPIKPGDHIWLAGCVLAYDIITEGDV